MSEPPRTPRDLAAMSADLIVRSYAVDGREEFVALFRHALERFGFEHFICGETDLSDPRRTAFALIEWPGDWESFYLEEGLIADDPVVPTMRSTANAFTWAQVRDATRSSSRAERVFDAAQDFGFREGAIIPIQRRGSVRGWISLCGSREPLSADELAVLAPLATHFYERFRSLDFEGPPANGLGLTARELQALALVAGGLTDQEIATRLGIARATAHEHVENAKAKLGVRSRAHAAALATSLDLLR